MNTNRPKAELIVELCGLQKEHSVQKVLKLIDILVQEVRVDNDTVGVDAFRVNQGEIRGYQKLQDHILKGLPSVQQSA